MQKIDIKYITQKMFVLQIKYKSVLNIYSSTKLKKNIFFEKIFVFFTKYALFAEKNIFIWEKSFIMKNYLLKKTFFTEKNIN